MRKAAKLGWCGRCEKRIFDFSDSGKPLRPNRTYSEIRFKLSNGTGMNVAMCRPCAEGFVHDEESCHEIIQNVIDGWRQHRPQYAEKMQGCCITGWEYVATFDLNDEGRPTKEKRVYHESIQPETHERRDPLLSL